jgi:hypothetical protein
MILESAFAKLPELLTRNFGQQETFEATVQHLLAVAVHMELDSRNISRAYERVITERPYPNKGSAGKQLHADLWVDFQGLVADYDRMVQYGWRPENWIEIKAYMSASRGGSAPLRTANVGRMLADLLRLCLLPNEGGADLNGRYLLVVADRSIESYLAFGSRTWLTNLFAVGKRTLQVNLATERKSVWKPIFPGVHAPDLLMDLTVNTMAFGPMRFHPDAQEWPPLFWGFLINTLAFEITFRDNCVKYDSMEASYWDSQGAWNRRLWTSQELSRLDQTRTAIFEAMRPSET